jgi:hypothetical protein
MCGTLVRICASTGHRYEDHVVELRFLRRALAFEGHLQPFLRGFDLGGFGLQHDVVETASVERLPNLHQVPVRPTHQAVEHFDYVEPGAQRRVHRAHFQAYDAAADDEHVLRTRAQFQRRGRVDDARIVRNERKPRRLRPGRDDRIPERGHLAPVFRFHGEMVRPGESAGALQYRHFAQARHAGKPAGELADHLALPCA